MPRQIRSSASWRAKRLMKGSYIDPKKKAHADIARFARAVDAISEKANDIYVDGCDTRRERHVYVLVRSKKGENFTYAMYNSNPDEDWVPAVQETYPRTKELTPKDFKKEENCVKQREQKAIFKVPRAPLMHFKAEEFSSGSE